MQAPDVVATADPELAVGATAATAATAVSPVQTTTQVADVVATVVPHRVSVMAATVETAALRAAELHSVEIPATRMVGPAVMAGLQSLVGAVMVEQELMCRSL
jgi:hypothetical protein